MAKRARKNGLSSVKVISVRLYQARMALRATQVEMAEHAVITPQAWNNCEVGRDRIGLDAAIRLYEATGFDLMWVYYGVKSSLRADAREALDRLESGYEPPSPAPSASSSQSTTRSSKSRDKSSTTRIS